jgi:hypothetical protein
MLTNLFGKILDRIIGSYLFFVGSINYIYCKGTQIYIGKSKLFGQ